MTLNAPTQNHEPARKAPNPWLLAARPRTLPAALAPVLLGSAFALQFYSEYGPAYSMNVSGSSTGLVPMDFLSRFRPLYLPALLCAAFALLGQIGANFANDYFDHRRGADAPGRLGPTRAVAAGLISPRAMLVATIITLGLSATAGLGTIYYGGWVCVLVGVASLLGAFFYTSFAYYGLGEVFALVYFGLVAVLGTYYVETGNWPAPPGVWIVATACGLLAANILLVNNIRDLATDARAGKRTLVVRLGHRFGHGFYIFNLGFACLTSLLLCAAAWSALTTRTSGVAIFTTIIAGIVIPLSIFLAHALVTTPEGNGPRFNRLLALSAQFLALWALLMSIGIAFS